MIDKIIFSFMKRQGLSRLYSKPNISSDRVHVWLMDVRQRVLISVTFIWHLNRLDGDVYIEKRSMFENCINGGHLIVCAKSNKSFTTLVPLAESIFVENIG